VSIRVIRAKKSLSPLQAYALKLAERLGGASPVFIPLPLKAPLGKY